MYSLITKIAHSTALKDTIAVARGIYRVISTTNPPINSSKGDWISNQTIRNIDSRITQGLEVQNKLQKNETENELINKSQVNTSILSENNQIDTKVPDASIKPSKEFKRQQIEKQAQENTDYSSLIQKYGKDNTFEQRQNKQSKVISSRLGRIYEYGKLGKWMLETEVQAYFARATGTGKQQEVYERGAQKITQQLCKMRGAPLKVIQMLSIQQDNLIPAPIRKAFQKAREQAHVMSEQQVQKALKSYLGQNWNEKFNRFDKKPFASASIGQVHRGASLQGDELAIKIQYPGVEKSIHSDMANLKMLLKLPGVLPKGIFLDKLLANTQKQLRQQCDYERQASMHSLYDQSLKAVMGNQYKKYQVPKIYKDLSTKYVMSSQFLKGIGVSRFEQDQIPQKIRNQVGRLVMKLTFSEIFEMGIMQSDPNPSNFTYNLEEKKLNLLDFGATHIYDQKFLNSYRAIINSSVAQNRQDIIKYSVQAGFLTNEENSVMLDNHVQSILMLGQPLRSKGVYDFGNQRITERIYKTIPQMLKNRLKSPPEQVYSLHRKLSGAYLCCIRMRSQVDCHKIFSELKADYKVKEFL